MGELSVGLATYSEVSEFPFLVGPLHFNVLHPRQWRSDMTEFDQLNDLLLLPFRQNLDPSVREIPSPASEAESASQIYDLSPEEDALARTADGYSGSGVQRMVRSIVEAPLLTMARYRLVSSSLQLDRWCWRMGQLGSCWSWLWLWRRRLPRDFNQFANQRLSFQSMNGREGA